MSLANPSRRGFLKAGGLLLVTVNLPAPGCLGSQRR